MNAEQPDAVEHSTVIDGDTMPGAASGQGRRAVQRRPRARTNPLAVAALILAVLLSPFAALFGHIALGQIARSQGRERGVIPAWIGLGLGYLWLIALVIVIGAVLVALSGGTLPGL